MPVNPRAMLGGGWTLIAAALVAGPARGQACPDPKPADFKKTNVAPGFFREPVELSVAGDGKVFVAERGGRLAAYDPATGLTTVAASFEVVLDGGNDKGGLLAVAVGPDFAQDNWVYVLYAPKALWNGSSTFATGKFFYRLSRLKYLGTKLDRPSEQVLLEFPVQWELHQAGCMIFGKEGNLYLSTGDNSAPWSNDQFSPMDERPGFEYSDDQRSTANTNDLRGKILRIHADAVTGRLFIAEFGPAAQRDTERGPAGADELSVTDEAANMGYPYFNKDNQPYCHWDYGQAKCVPIQGQTSLKYDPLRPVNFSRNNTGLNLLPPAKPAVLWEHDGPNPDPVPGLEGCGFGVGPVYHFDPALASKVKFPPWFDGKGFLYAIGGPWQPKVLIIPPGPPSPIKQVVATSFSLNFGTSVHDMEYGPDGSLYVVDYEGGNNGLHQVTYGGCLPPVSVQSGIAAERGKRRPCGKCGWDPRVSPWA